MARRSDEREATRAEYMARKEKGGEVNLRQLASGGGSPKTGGILPPTGNPADSRETRTPRATPAAGHRRAT